MVEQGEGIAFLTTSCRQMTTVASRVWQKSRVVGL